MKNEVKFTNGKNAISIATIVICISLITMYLGWYFFDILGTFGVYAFFLLVLVTWLGRKGEASFRGKRFFFIFKQCMKIMLLYSLIIGLFSFVNYTFLSPDSLPYDKEGFMYEAFVEGAGMSEEEAFRLAPYFAFLPTPIGASTTFFMFNVFISIFSSIFTSFIHILRPKLN